MAKGFENPSDELKVQAGVKRLTPSAKRNDVHALADGVRELQRKYGHAIADEAMRRVIEQYPDLCNGMLDVIGQVSPAMKQEVYAKSLELMADVLVKAGLRLEDHMRVTDEGFALTKEAVKAIAATGYPDMESFGEGNDSLEGMGIDRTEGFVHPLSDAIKATKKNGLPEDCLNLWACVSVMISCAQGWLEADKDKSFAALQECVSRSAPTVDLKTLMYRARYDDRALLRLCNLAHAGLEGKVNVVFEG